MAAYHKGEDLMKEKKYKEAQDVFWKECAEKYKDYPIREDATFMSGECYYFQKLYADAEDQYSLVVKEYTATRAPGRDQPPKVRDCPPLARLRRRAASLRPATCSR